MTIQTITEDGEVVQAHAAPLTLFGTDNPEAIVERATRIATALADVLAKRKLVKRFGNNEYVLLEGWTLLGSMLGVFAQVEWTRPIEDGWEARAVVRTMSGAAVGSAEAMCTSRETKWAKQDAYAVRSMAQTRALAKALRMPLGFIVELAGYAATPAEEMPDGLPDIPEQPKPGQIPLSALRLRVVERAEEHDIPREILDDITDSAYEGKKFAELTKDELLSFGTDITHGKYDVPFDEPGADEREQTQGLADPAMTPPSGPTIDDVLRVTGGELVDEQPAVSPPAGEAVAGKAVLPAADDPLQERVRRAKARAEAAT